MRKFSTFNSTEYEFLRHCEEQRTYKIKRRGNPVGEGSSSFL